jgi:hypothetical protein
VPNASSEPGNDERRKYFGPENELYMDEELQSNEPLNNEEKRKQDGQAEHFSARFMNGKRVW